MAINPLQPLDYTPSTPSFFQGIAPAVQLGGLIGSVMESQERAKAEREATVKQQAAINKFLSNPNPTHKDTVEFALNLPSKTVEAITPFLKGVGEEQLRPQVQFGISILSALKRDPAMAADLLRKRSEASKNSGREQDAGFYADLAKDVETNGPKNAYSMTGMLLASLPGGKEAIENLAKAEETQIKAAEAGPKLRISQAEADIKERESKGEPAPPFVNTEQGVMQWDRSKGRLVPTGYTVSKTPPVQVSINEGQKGFENETTLRKEFNDLSKPLTDVKSSYNRLQAAAQDTSGASDIAMIYSYMKMLDPGSVVREGEFATAANAGGIPEKIRNTYNKVMEGNRLTPVVRNQYLSVAKNIYGKTEKDAQKLTARYSDIAKRAGLNPQNIVTEGMAEDKNSVDELLKALGK